MLHPFIHLNFLDIHTHNTQRTSINIPNTTGNEIKPKADEMYMHCLDDQIEFDPTPMSVVNNPSNYGFQFDHTPLEFLSPPGSGYTSPQPAYMSTSLNDQHLISSYEARETKTETDHDFVLLPYTAHQRQGDLQAAGLTLDQEPFLSTDTCPETPDDSLNVCKISKIDKSVWLKFPSIFQEGDIDSPDSCAYTCLWDFCHEEFDNQKSFVEHLSEIHTETKKGCEEFPCLWKV